METGFRGFFLIPLLLLAVTAPAVHAQQPEQGSGLIKPTVERSQFDESLIDTEDFELVLSVGYISIEDFGVNPIYEFSFNYYVNERIFVQLALGQAQGSQTSYEVLSGSAPLLTDQERQLRYYQIDVGYNLLPGEAFITENTTYNTVFYLSGGIGTSQFAGSERFTINYGAGYRFLLADAISLTLDFRNQMFDTDVFGQIKTTNNLRFTLGAGWYF